MAYEVMIDSDECISAGKCVAAAPSFFGFDENEIAVVLADGVATSDEHLVRIARVCPSGAITLRLDGNEVDIGI
jgi:ferredoxin